MAGLLLVLCEPAGAAERGADAGVHGPPAVRRQEESVLLRPQIIRETGRYEHYMFIAGSSLEDAVNDGDRVGFLKGFTH